MAGIMTCSRPPRHSRRARRHRQTRDCRLPRPEGAKNGWFNAGECRNAEQNSARSDFGRIRHPMKRTVAGLSVAILMFGPSSVLAAEGESEFLVAESADQIR